MTSRQDATSASTGTAAPPESAARTLGIPILMVIAIGLIQIGALVAWRPDLPDPMATHFSGSGRADGFMSWTANLVMALGFSTVLTIVLLVGFHLGGGRGRMARIGAAIGVGTSGFVGALMLAAAAAQRGRADAHDARLSPAWIAAGLAAGLALAGLAYAVTPASPWPTPDPAETPRMTLRPGEKVVWSSERRNRTLTLVGLGLSLLGLALLVVGPVLNLAGGLVLPGVLMAVLGALFASVGRVRVTVDGAGLRWRMGPLFGRTPLSRITSARVVDVVPMEYGGWGYRLSGQGPAVVIGAGHGLRISRAGGSDFTVTVPDAETGAALLNGLIAGTGRGG
ncbi:MAG: DUF1648 domain-containing protein [Tetrasphaera sp.]|nr:DUF1648 domain-containing protein [Tetrasphaera sp.]